MWTCHIIEAYMTKFEMLFREAILYRSKNYTSPEFCFAKLHNQHHVSLVIQFKVFKFFKEDIINSDVRN